MYKESGWDLGSCTFDILFPKSRGNGYVDMELGIEGNLFRYVRDLGPFHGHVRRV